MDRGCESSLVIAVNGGSSSEIVLSSPVQERGIASDVEFNNVRSAKRVARSIDRVPKKQFVGTLEDIKASCEQLNAKQSDFIHLLHDVTRGEGGSIWKLREDLAEFSEKIMCDQAQMRNDIIRIQNNQDQILKALENLEVKVLEKSVLQNSEGKEHLGVLEQIVPELRSATNKLNAMLKIQSSGIAEVRGIANKMNALSKCYWSNSTQAVNDPGNVVKTTPK